MTTEVHEKWFLSLPKDIKLKLLSDMLKEEEHGMALGTMKMLLDAPITEGGISSDELKEVWYVRIDKTIENIKGVNPDANVKPLKELADMSWDKINQNK